MTGPLQENIVPGVSAYMGYSSLGTPGSAFISILRGQCQWRQSPGRSRNLQAPLRPKRTQGPRQRGPGIQCRRTPPHTPHTQTQGQGSQSEQTPRLQHTAPQGISCGGDSVGVEVSSLVATLPQSGGRAIGGALSEMVRGKVSLVRYRSIVKIKFNISLPDVDCRCSINVCHLIFSILPDHLSLCLSLS